MTDRRTPFAVLLVLLFGSLSTVRAQPRERSAIPPVLSPWIDWVLVDNEEALCPDVDGVRICVWPASLALDVRETSATFTLAVSTNRRTRVRLPGSSEHWPLDVRVGSVPAVVIEPAGLPEVEVASGSHVIQGRFAWSKIPDSLAIAANVGSVSLSIAGERIDAPRREQDGLLWLRDASRGGDETESLELGVHRRIEDGLPMRIVTRIQVSASGQAREVVLPNVLLAGTRAIEISSELPARLAPDGSLRMQTEAGSYRVSIIAVSESPPPLLRAPSADAPWPDSEIWVFVASDRIRHVELSGAAQIDPARTDLAADWHGLPTYVLPEGSALTFETKRRGEPDPAPNAVSLSRMLWLDADGEGYTVRDELKGSLQREFRFDLLSGELGRVTVDGRDELITQHNKHAGIELRRGALDMAAEFRLAGTRDLPAVAWSEDVQSLSAKVALPPGFTLLGVEGVDHVPGTWFDTWDLWDFFFVLLMALAIGKLCSLPWGVLALCSLVLAHHEPEAPELVWLGLIVATALSRVLKAERLRWIVKVVWLMALAGMLLVAIPFSVHQLRRTLYPHLVERGSWMDEAAQLALVAEPELSKEAEESAQDVPSAQPSSPALGYDADSAASGEQAAQKAAEALLQGAVGSSSRGVALGDALGGAAGVGVATRKAKRSSYGSTSDSDVDPNAVVQTGPGLPTWRFQEHTLSWSGPVQRDQRIKLWLVPPLATRIWSLLTVLLTGALLFALTRAGRPFADDDSIPPASRSSVAPVALAMMMMMFGVATTAQAEDPQAIPSTEILNELRSRLLKPATCEPQCLSVAELAVTIDRDTLKLRATVHAAATTAYQAPGPLATFAAREVRVDGRSALAALRSDDGFLRVRIEPGVHNVELSGPITPHQTLTLALGSQPHRVTVKAEGFEIDGLHEDGTAEGSLRFRPALTIAPDGTPEQAREGLAPWLELNRVIDLGVRFRVRTTLRRIGPTGESVLVHVPLLPGESVTEAGIDSANGRVVIELPRDAMEVSFTSALAPRNDLTLTAALPSQQGSSSVVHPWNETWQVACSTLYHCTFDGLAPIERLDASGAMRPAYKPWPGEKLHIQAQRLGAARGASVTIDSATLDLTPGSRIEEGSLRMFLRTSRGTTERISLPEGATLKSVKVDGVERPLRIKDKALELVVGPGQHEVTIDLRRNAAMELSYRAPAVRLHRAVTNATTRVNMPEQRWLLWTSGPSMGPAVLFWGYLLIVVLGALALGSVPLSPLKHHQWVLLGLGLTQIPVVVVLIIVGWFFALAARERHPPTHRLRFNMLQVALVLFTVIALSCLAGAVHQGLVVQPDMQVQGMGSHNGMLSWYEDRTTGTLPSISVLSVPLWIYKALMLAWALWLAASLLHWLRWGFNAFRAGDAWRRAPQNPKVDLRNIEAAKAALEQRAAEAKPNAGDS
jgi:hypothetical protein